MDVILKQIKEYAGLFGTLAIAALLTAVAYGANQATAAATLANHEARLIAVETASRNTNDLLIRVDQKVSDIWKDNGHKE